jgi:hypothetical protein
VSGRIRQLVISLACGAVGWLIGLWLVPAGYRPWEHVSGDPWGLAPAWVQNDWHWEETAAYALAGALIPWIFVLVADRFNSEGRRQFLRWVKAALLWTFLVLVLWVWNQQFNPFHSSLAGYGYKHPNRLALSLLILGGASYGAAMVGSGRWGRRSD